MIEARSASRSWYRQWREAATGRHGFWHDQHPQFHFRTSSITGRQPAQMIARLLEDRPEIRTVIEVGAGSGDLLAWLSAVVGDRTLIGVDMRPAGRSGLRWCHGIWDTETAEWTGPASDLFAGLSDPTMIIAAEWLDDLPCPIVQSEPSRVVDAPGARWREVMVDETGTETAGARLTDDRPEHATLLAWIQRWWDTPTSASARAEIGTTRDRAWAALITALSEVGGTGLMIDYGHLRGERPAGGTLTGYIAGRELSPAPDGQMNLTADVAVDAVADAGRVAGAQTTFLISQAEAVRRLLPRPTVVSDRLAELQDRSERHALASNLGQHWWLLQEVRSSTRLVA